MEKGKLAYYASWAGCSALIGLICPYIAGDIGYSWYKMLQFRKAETNATAEYAPAKESIEIERYHIELRSAFETFKLENKSDPTPKDILKILQVQLDKYSSGLPKNETDWSKEQKEVYDHGAKMIRLYAEKTAQSNTQARLIKSYQPIVNVTQKTPHQRTV